MIFLQSPDRKTDMRTLFQHIHRRALDLRRQVSVPQRHFHIGVPQEHPHGVQVHALHNELGSEVVAHVVPTEVFNVRLLE